MKKLQKLSLKELGESVKVLDNEHVNKLKGGYGSDYPYYSPGNAYCIAQGPGHIGTLGELQREQAAYEEIGNWYTGGGLVSGLVSAGNSSLPLSLFGVAIGAYGWAQDQNGDKIGAVVDSLQKMGYNPDSKIRIEYLDSYSPGLTEGGACRVRIWNAETGQLMYETLLNN